VLGFRIARPVTQKYIQSKLDEGNEAFFDKATKWIPTKDKRVKVGYTRQGGGT
jgi:hypothetical protein